MVTFFYMYKLFKLSSYSILNYYFFYSDNFMNHPVLYPILPFLSSFFMEYYWIECLDRLKNNNQLPMEYQTENSPIVQITTKYAFGILDGYVWKVKFGEKSSKKNLSFQNSDDVIENWYDCFDYHLKKINKETYDHLNIHLYMDTMNSMYEWFVKETTSCSEERKATTKTAITSDELTTNLIKWKIETGRSNIKLEVFKRIYNDNEWDLVCTRMEKIKQYYCFIIASLSF